MPRKLNRFRSRRTNRNKKGVSKGSRQPFKWPSDFAVVKGALKPLSFGFNVAVAQNVRGPVVTGEPLRDFSVIAGLLFGERKVKKEERYRVVPRELLLPQVEQFAREPKRTCPPFPVYADVSLPEETYRRVKENPEKFVFEVYLPLTEMTFPWKKLVDRTPVFQSALENLNTIYKVLGYKKRLSAFPVLCRRYVNDGNTTTIFYPPEMEDLVSEVLKKHVPFDPEWRLYVAEGVSCEYYTAFLTVVIMKLFLEFMQELQFHVQAGQKPSYKDLAKRLLEMGIVGVDVLMQLWERVRHEHKKINRLLAL